MAWVDGRWLERKERQALIDEYRALINAALALPASAMSDDEQAEIAGYIAELERLERIHRAESDLLYFAWEYFSERRNPGNSGNWEDFDIPFEERGGRIELHAAQFHKEICELIDHVSTEEKNAKVAVAAPRSHAKSSYLSKANPLREICFRKRRYIIIISETPSVATANLEWLATQLKSNEKLRNDFGPLLSPKQQTNPRDNSTEFIAWEPQGEDGQKQLTLVQAASTGQALRGRNWNGSRPDMVICDDLEDLRSNAATKEQRDKLKGWFSQVVMPLGDPKGKRTAFIYMGTIVHPSALLMDVIKNRPDFKSRLYKALIQEPERQDLWEECRAIFCDETLSKTERVEKAYEFYLAHKAEMDRGAKVLWPEVQPLWKLMTWKWANGAKAFNTEYQNNPIDEESAIFHVEEFSYFDYGEVNERELDFFTAWDIAWGRSSRADYNAIVTVGRHRRTGILYVWDVFLSKCPAHKALGVAIEKMKQFRPKAFFVETVGGQIDMARQLKDAILQNGIYFTKLVAAATKRGKAERIESLEPLCANGTLRFHRSQRLLLEMLEQYPSHNHDDGPDALQYAVELASKSKMRRRTYKQKPLGF